MMSIAVVIVSVDPVDVVADIAKTKSCIGSKLSVIKGMAAQIDERNPVLINAPRNRVERKILLEWCSLGCSLYRSPQCDALLHAWVF